MKHFLHRYRTLILAVLVLIAWSAIFLFIPADSIIANIGVQNSYIVSFLVTLAAGWSFFTGTTAYATVIEFARGGSDPLLLGITSGIGLFLSDTFFYWLAIRGRTSVESKFHKGFKRIQDFIARVPNAIVYVGVYLFCAFGPIPNDVILVTLVVGGYKYRKFWPYLLLGDITFMLFLSYIFRQ